MDPLAAMLAAILGPMYLVMGLSLLFYVPVWQKIMKGFSKDHLALIPMKFFLLILGTIFINMYNVWAWDIGLLVTLIGWGMFLKGVFYFLLPGSWLKDLFKTFNTKPALYFGGAFALVVGIVLCYYGYYDMGMMV